MTKHLSRIEVLLHCQQWHELQTSEDFPRISAAWRWRMFCGAEPTSVQIVQSSVLAGNNPLPYLRQINNLIVFCSGKSLFYNQISGKGSLFWLQEREFWCQYDLITVQSRLRVRTLSMGNTLELGKKHKSWYGMTRRGKLDIPRF